MTAAMSGRIEIDLQFDAYTCGVFDTVIENVPSVPWKKMRAFKAVQKSYFLMSTYQQARR
jgi:hypothetical protein